MMEEGKVTVRIQKVKKNPDPAETILFCSTCGIASAGYDICKTVVSL